MSGNITAKDLGINPGSHKEADLFKWFLASYLFGKRIQQDIAKQTWEVFMKHNIDSAEKITDRSWQDLVDLLGEGHYKRYDESTASNLLDMANLLSEKYDGKVSNVLKESENYDDLTNKLEEFKGVGPKTAEIFTREI